MNIMAAGGKQEVMAERLCISFPKPSLPLLTAHQSCVWEPWEKSLLLLS